MYQIKRFHSFLWLSGGAFSDFFIHNIDECCWMKNDWPVEARAIGGRHYRGDNIDQNFDSYSVEYTFPDGTKLFLDGRNVTGCEQQFASYLHGTKGCAVVSEKGHAPSRARIHKGQVIHQVVDRRARPGEEEPAPQPPHPDTVWAYPQTPPEPSPYDLEWQDLIAAIQKDERYNEVERGVKASLVASMGRMAAHTGQLTTYETILNSTHEFSPLTDQLTADSNSPLMPFDDGSYPIPEPGIKTDREY
jgi:predicted dehydrogenase